MTTTRRDPGPGCWPGWTPGDTRDEQLARTWVAAQDLRLIFACPDRARAADTLYRWLAYCAHADIPELTRLARTIDSWQPELLAYFDTGGVSNGGTEAINLIIEKTRRLAHGFRNFDNYRLRILLVADGSRPYRRRPDHAYRRRAHLVGRPLFAYGVEVEAGRR